MDVIISWAFLITVALLYILYRVYKNRLLLTDRQNRLQIYGIFTLLLAFALGQVGSSQKNNIIFYFASVATELTVYLWLVRVKLSNEADKKLIRLPVAFAGLLIVNIAELTCFWLAGNDFWRFSMATHTEIIRSNWLMLGGSITLIYVMILTLCTFFEHIQNARESSELSSKYNSYFSTASYILIFSYFTTDLARYVVYILLGNPTVLEVGFIVRDVILVPCFLLFLVRVFADKYLYIQAKKFYDRRNLALLAQLENIYNWVTAVFPADYRFNAYEVMRDNIKSPTWALTEVLDSFSDLRHYFWQAEATRSGEKNLPLNTTVEQEYRVWKSSLLNPDGTKNLLKKSNRAIRPPKLQCVSNTQKALFYLKVFKRLEAKRPSNGKEFYAR
jgi:hypothetical protein